MFGGITRIFFDAWNIALLKCHIHLIPLGSVKACLFPEESMWQVKQDQNFFYGVT